MITIRSLLSCAIYLFLVWLCSSCAQPTQEEATPAPIDVPVLLPYLEQRQALQEEQEENYWEAYVYWSEAELLLKYKLKELSRELRQISEVHLQQGMSFFELNQPDQALEEFITALKYYPENQTALDYLKNKYRPEKFFTYTIQDSDSPATIAKKMYRSSSYSFLVTHFSNIGEKGFKEDTVIELVDLESFRPRELMGYKRDILIARKLFKAGEFTSVLPLARTLLEDYPGDQEASYIINMSLLGIAQNQQDQERFEEAITALTQVDPAFRKVNRQIRHIRGLQLEKQLEQAEFSDDKLIRMAEDLYDQGHYLKARTVLEQTGQDFPGRDKAFTKIQKKLDQEAEYHYKKGVKYFVDEKLDAAINEWEETLRLNPEHRNGRSSLKQARDLLDKYKRIN